MKPVILICIHIDELVSDMKVKLFFKEKTESTVVTALILLEYIGRSYDIVSKQFVEISLTFGFGKES